MVLQILLKLYPPNLKSKSVWFIKYAMLVDMMVGKIKVSFTKDNNAPIKQTVEAV